MDKRAIERFAVWARRELMERVTRRAARFGITAEADTHIAGLSSVGATLFSAAEAAQRDALVQRILEKGFAFVMEEVAYTWFNRFCALRFMEVNDYLPTHLRVFTNAAGEFKPQILAEALALELPAAERTRLLQAMQEGAADEVIFKQLLIWQCNDLGTCLPGMFERIGDYTELLFPDNILREDSVIARLVSDIPEEDWKDAVQIIGWLYQYYNTEPKADVFAGLKKNVKISKDTIPAATQLFTSDWIVRYMVENSLGRLWLEGHPDAALQATWKYYLPEAEQTPEVQAALCARRAPLAALHPEDISCIDPCMGSGHILVYMFDVLMQIYLSQGYRERDAVAAIVQHNLHGLDIDDRAGQLAYFAVMMKARQYDRRWLTRGIQPQVYAIQESNFLTDSRIDALAEGDMALRADLLTLQTEMQDAKEYGSILRTTAVDAESLLSRLNGHVPDSFPSLVHSANLLSRTYDIVVTNPPYMGSNGMGSKLAAFVKAHYPDTKSDLSTVMMEQSLRLCTERGMMAMINIPVWMFLSSFESLRHTIIRHHTIINMAHAGRGIFGSDFGTTAFVIAQAACEQYIGSYRRLFDKPGDVHTVDVKESWYLTGKGSYTAAQENYVSIPGAPIGYWISNNVLNLFRNPALAHAFTTREGMATADNNVFLRGWYEVVVPRISWDSTSEAHALQTGKKWYPYNKGGEFRKWYGNNYYVVDWENGGYRIKHNCDPITKRVRSHNYNGEYAFREGITWSALSAGDISVRFAQQGFLFDSKGAKGFCESRSYLYIILGFLNSTVAKSLLTIFSSTIDYKVGDIIQLPMVDGFFLQERAVAIVEYLISLSRDDWDSFETSWDFRRHPLIMPVDLVQKAYISWEDEAQRRFEQLKANEEELNRVFIDIYGLQDELTPEVEEKDVTVRRADRGREVRSLISYAVGCMFGRYSLDEEGLIYAGGEWNPARYASFEADADNIIPISDDEYFGDDIVKRFCEFIATVYGEAHLEENLQFIAESLGGGAADASRDVLRRYFLKDFYADHCKIYQKRPIYWLFDSGKKNGFKALMYIHRYDRDTLARLRTDYVHRQQDRYRTAISHLEEALPDLNGSEKVRKTADLQRKRAQLEEISAYEETLQHLADRHMSMDLDDGVKHNYTLFPGLLAKIK